MNRIAMATLLMGALGMVIPSRPARAQVTVSVSIGGFYDELSPHGEWIDCSYGECWVPRGVGAGWQPYTNGEWIYTRYGWTWLSNDPWGGDPYHYGTWAFISRHGWVWVPGTVWAPAWVTWSYSDRYVGWAPMPPTVRFGSSGYSGRAVVVNQAQYVFVPTDRFVGTNVTTVRVEPRRNAEIFRQSKSVTRFEVSGGIVRNVALPVATVQRAMGGRVIETREIDTARTSPRSLSSGGVRKGGPVAIVAPARDVKAARASRQEPAPNAASGEPQRQVKQPPQERRQQPAQPQARPQQEPQVRQPQERRPQQAQPRQQEQPQPRPQQQEKRPPQAPQQQPPQQAQPQPARPQQEHGKAMPAEHSGRDQKAGKKDRGGDERPK